jgi:predicted dienelactone hydrolase
MRALLIPIAALCLSGPAAAKTVCEAVLTDAAREGRGVPVRLRLPDAPGKAPLILFSHGLGGNLDAGTRWAEAWVKAGFAVAHLQHPGSDSGVWQGLRGAAAVAALRPAASGPNLVARVADVRFVVDSVVAGGKLGTCDLSRVDTARIGMSGHSFGAHTTLAIAGQRFELPGGARAMGDPRVRAAIALSPAPPARGSDEVAFGAISMPLMSLTGTADLSPVSPEMTAADRERPHRAMQPGHKYLLVFDGADHQIFGGNGLRRAETPNDERVAILVERATTDFWRAALLPKTPAPMAKPNGLGDRDPWEAR